MIRTYSELAMLDSYIARYNYLRLSGIVGKETFGFDRYLNQLLYTSPEWRRARDEVIVRDNGCDLGVEGFEIQDMIVVHHMNPITITDIENRNPEIFNPEFLISTAVMTHKAIHYGNKNLLPSGPVVRRKNDTSPWLR